MGVGGGVGHAAAAADADDAPKRGPRRSVRVRAVLLDSSARFASQPRRELGLRRAHERTERARRASV